MVAVMQHLRPSLHRNRSYGFVRSTDWLAGRCGSRILEAYKILGFVILGQLFSFHPQLTLTRFVGILQIISVDMS